MSLTRRLATGLIIRGAGIRDLKELKEIYNDNTVSLSATPFGATGPIDVLYVKNPVMWKGLKGNAFWKFANGYQPKKKGSVKGAIANGLRSAIRISRACSGRKGVARHPKGGYLIPAKALCQIETSQKEGGAPKSMKRYVRVTQLLK